MKSTRKKISDKVKETFDGEYTTWKGYKIKGKPTKEPSMASIKKDLWENYVAPKIKERDGNDCISCGKWAEGYNLQAGHFEPKGSGGAVLYYHPYNIHSQCGGCNSNEGNRTEYFPSMEALYGRDYVDKLVLKKHKKSVQMDSLFLEEVRQYYEIGDFDGLADWLDNL